MKLKSFQSQAAAAVWEHYGSKPNGNIIVYCNDFWDDLSSSKRFHACLGLPISCQFSSAKGRQEAGSHWSDDPTGASFIFKNKARL